MRKVLEYCIIWGLAIWVCYLFLIANAQREANIQIQSQFIPYHIPDRMVEYIPDLDKYTSHILTPGVVKSIYYTGNAISYAPKKENLLDLIDTTEINSVTIDIKTVSGYVNFDMSDGKFSSIVPVSNNTIADISSIIEELHEKWVYVIGRVVVFKDKYLAETRPDLAIKWKGTDNVWYDYKWLKYLDPGAQQVWDYNAEIASYAYDIWFDEINFDYVRFPTDGRISETYYPYSQTQVDASERWGRIRVLDNFSAHITSKLREKHPDIKLSADIFGLVTNNDGVKIGQNLESFMLHFDFVWPMIYPSHYGAWYLWFTQPDNHPYEIFADSIKNANARIDTLNQKIHNITASGGILKISEEFVPQIDNPEKLEYSVVRPWIQGFSCTWCPGATTYDRSKFRSQIQGMQSGGLSSWWVWSSGSNYYREWYNAR